MLPSRLAYVLRNLGPRLGPGVAGYTRKEQLKLKIHVDGFDVDPQTVAFFGQVVRLDRRRARMVASRLRVWSQLHETLGSSLGLSQPQCL